MATMFGITSASPDGLVGQVVQNHEIIRVLGVGGMGEVYVARHRTLGTLRALKVIHDDIKERPATVERFRREALVLAQIQHPNVVSVIDYGQLDNGWPYLMLEFVEGANLAAIVRGRGPLSLPEALVILHQIARVIEFTHDQGIVHRDLEPSNVLLGDNDPRQVKVIDFGLVKLLSPELLIGLTTERQVVGSPHYMAPEQARGSGEITGATDVYALAGLAYTLLSGRSVFGDRSPLALIYAQGNETPERLSARITIPDRLDELLYSSLAKNPADRPSASVMASEFEQILADAGGAPEAMAPLMPPDGPGAAGVPDEVLADSTAREAGIPDEVLADSTAREDGVPAEIPLDMTDREVSVPDAVSRDRTDREAGVPDAVLLDRTDREVAIPDAVLLDRTDRVVDVASAADIIFAPLPRSSDHQGREELQLQMLGVIGELAEALESLDHEIAALRDGIATIEGRLAELEVDAARLDADLDGGSEEQRVDLTRRRAEIAAQANQLRTSLDANQRTLAVFVGHRRPSAPPETGALYDELERMVERTLSLPPAAAERRDDE